MFEQAIQGLASDYGSFTWFTLIPDWDEKNHAIFSFMGDSWIEGKPVAALHMLLAAIMTVVVLLVASAAAKKFRNPDKFLIPEAKPSARNLVEVVLDAIYNLAKDGMGERYARLTLPLVGTVTMYVFFSNILGLVPGFAPPTDNLNATLAPALVVVFFTHYHGVREHGVASYCKHFLGPVAFIAPLYLFIEIVGHVARVVSLSFRLMGNMIGDHKVLAAFVGFPVAASYFIPVPFFILGLVVCTMQTLVFAMLSIVYIQLAVAHADH